jgi:hypothetical protein
MARFLYGAGGTGPVPGGYGYYLFFLVAIELLVILLPQFFGKKLRKTSSLKNPFPSEKNIEVKYCGIPQFSYNIAVFCFYTPIQNLSLNGDKARL